jgi:hypothetical protein
MAKITDETQELILTEHKTGKFSQRELAKRYKLGLGTINKICKGVEQSLKDTIAKGTQYNTELATLSEVERATVKDVVSDNVKALMFFSNSAIKNQNLADKILAESKNLNDLETHSRITARNKETVLGKEPQTVINNTNAQQNQKTGLDLSNLSDDELETLDAILSKAN